MAERHKIIPASSLIFRRGNEIALLRRCNTGFKDGDYDLITGHVDPGESFRIAATREGKEEGGVKINLNDLKAVHTMQRLQKNGEERINVFFEVKKWEGKLRNMEPKKCDELRWFNINDLPKNIVPYVRTALKHIKEEKHYSEYGWAKLI